MLSRKCFVLSESVIFLIARKIPAPVMLEAEVVHHRGEHDDDPDLHDHVQTDLEAVDFFWLCGRGGLVSHRLKSPFPRLKRLVGEVSITIVMLR